MRILVTGKTGQLGQAFAEQAAKCDLDALSFTFADRHTIDLGSPQTFEAALEAAAPDVVINAAAYTAVDLAEDETEKAFSINAKGPGVLAELAAARGARFVQVSTDYVFDGNKLAAYNENDVIDPQGVYGQSKADGEAAVRAACDAHDIVRTAWVYSPFGQNFPKTMLRLAGDRDEINVVEDQFGSPTSAHDLADGLLAMCRHWHGQSDMGTGQAYHLAGSGEANWADVAREVFRISQEGGGPTARVIGIPSSSYPTKAKRPANSRLDCGLFFDTFGYRSPDWRASLRIVVERLLRQ